MVMYELQPILLTPAEATKVLHMSLSRVYELVKTPGFPVVNNGRRILIPYKLLEEWILENLVVV